MTTTNASNSIWGQIPFKNSTASGSASNNGTTASPAASATPPAQPQPTQSQAIINDLQGLGFTFRLNLLDDTLEVNNEPINDVVRAQIRTAMRDHNPKYNRMLTAIEDAYIAEAARNSFNPIADYLNRLAWDGADHIGTLASYLSSDDPSVSYDDGTTRQLHHAYLRRWLIGAVGKAFDRRQNMMLVLAGPQGCGKSSFAAWLCNGVPDLFLRKAIDPSDKDSQLRLLRHLVWEVDELDAVTRRHDVAALKAFISTDKVTVRPSYGRSDITKCATASLIGTVNPGSGFLADETGSRRFYVASITGINWAYAALVDPNQVWAHAVALYRAGEPWQLLPCEQALQVQQNALHETESTLDDFLRRYFDLEATEDDYLTAGEIVEHLKFYNIKLSGSERAQSMDISRALAHAPTVRKIRTTNYRGYSGIKKLFLSQIDLQTSTPNKPKGGSTTSQTSKNAASAPTPATPSGQSGGPDMTTYDNLSNEVVIEDTASGSVNDNYDNLDNLNTQLPMQDVHAENAAHAQKFGDQGCQVVIDSQNTAPESANDNLMRLSSEVVIDDEVVIDAKPEMKIVGGVVARLRAQKQQRDTATEQA